MITLNEIIERDQRPPSVTVYMICYNHEKYLDEAVKGVLMQKTNFPVQIVIHDDASTDRSQEIIRRYASENPNMTTILEETNYYQNGKSFFPKVLPYLTGKYIAFCECDDFWIDEHKLQIQVDYLESNPRHMAVCGNTLPVNKYSQYDESTRTHFLRTKKGDYPRGKILGIGHQLASFVIRNLYLFMTSEDINFYLSIRASGDEKIFALCMGLGMVHHFSEEFAAHRRVTDEGDSYSARMKRISEYERVKLYALQYTELYRMIEHFWGKKYLRKYIGTLWSELHVRIKYRSSLIKDIPLPECYHLRNIPLYIWPTFAAYVTVKVVYEVAKKAAKAVLPKNVLTFMKKLRYNQLSALSSQLSALSSGYDCALVLSYRTELKNIRYLLSIKATDNFFVPEYLQEAA